MTPAPLPLVEKYKPTTFEDFAGLGDVKKVLTAFCRKPYTPTSWLFVGDAGTGKTTIAFAMAKAIGAQIHHLPARRCTLDEVEKTILNCWYIPQSGQFHLVLVDEADQMTNPAQISFLSIIDGTNPPPATVFVFTCNDTSRLQDRFRSRCRVLDFQGDPEATLPLLKRVWNTEAPPGATMPDLAAIARTTKGNIRTALMTLEVELLTQQPQEETPVKEPREMEIVESFAEAAAEKRLRESELARPGDTFKSWSKRLQSKEPVAVAVAASAAPLAKGKAGRCNSTDAIMSAAVAEILAAVVTKPKPVTKPVTKPPMLVLPEGVKKGDALAIRYDQKLSRAHNPDGWSNYEYGTMNGFLVSQKGALISVRFVYDDYKPTTATINLETGEDLQAKVICTKISRSAETPETLKKWAAFKPVPRRKAKVA